MDLAIFLSSWSQLTYKFFPSVSGQIVYLRPLPQWKPEINVIENNIIMKKGVLAHPTFKNNHQWLNCFYLHREIPDDLPSFHESPNATLINSFNSYTSRDTGFPGFNLHGRIILIPDTKVTSRQMKPTYRMSLTWASLGGLSLSSIPC